MNKIAFVFDRESDAPDPGMMIVLRDGVLRFYADPKGRYAETASRLNNGCMALSRNEAPETFEDMVDRYDGQASMAQVAELKGRDARRFETLYRRWKATK